MKINFKTHRKSLSKNCRMALVTGVLMFLVLPIKIFLFLAVVYAVAHLLGGFQLKFPDVWDLEENIDDVEKPHKTFLSVPTKIDGTWYVFCYVYKVVTDGVTSLSIKPITEVQDSEVKDETIN